MPAAIVPHSPIRPGKDVNSRSLPLDQLRGIAILLVIASHAVLYMPTGFAAVDRVASLGRFGVQLFFIVSAYTMCMMWAGRKGEPHPVKHFYLRRIARIAPAFWIALILYLLLRGTGPNFFAPQGLGALEIGLTAAFLHGLWPAAINAVVPGGWSIATEMMFYALFPLLASRKCGSWAAIGAAIVSILGVAPAVRAWLPGSPSLLEQFAALNAVQQLPAFFCGMLIYRWTHGAPSAREAWTLAIGLGLIAALAVAIGEARLGVPMLVVLAETALVRWALAGAHHARVLGLLGRNSYVIYLSHFALFMGLHPLLPRGPGWTLIGFVLVAAGSCLLSEAFERTIGRAIHDWVARRTGTGRQAGGSQPKPRNTTPP